MTIEQKPRFTAMTYEDYDLIRSLMWMSTTVSSLFYARLLFQFYYPQYLMEIRNPR